jgi:ABC-type dipeptide/oligopeptide/nickel transport system permease subunit
MGDFMDIREFLKIVLKQKLSVFCGVIVLLILLMGVFADVIAPHDPYEMDLSQKFLGVSSNYPMGTDNMGRCIFSRILYATRATLAYSSLCTVCAAIIGITLGMIAGYSGGGIDQIIMRLCDILYAFPNLVLVLVIVSFLGPGIVNVIIAMLLTQWLWYARVARNLAQSEKARSYVAAAKLSGSSSPKIIYKHLLPNIIPQMLAIITIDFGHTILSISGYSFLGLGIQPPSPEWGAMINEGRAFINSDPMMMFWPGMMILIAVICANILGDNMRDIMDKENI